MKELVRAEILVSGYVQGVGYRFFAAKHAISLGLTGFVKNLWDGNVNIIVEGEKDNIELYQRYLKQGPSRSMVKNVQLVYTQCLNKFNSFQIE